METIRIGTRKSKLATWQAEYIAEKLQAGGLKTDLVLMDTRGDKILDVSISKIGSKGVFTEELEEMLSAGMIDIAVHSAKDLQSSLPAGFELIAFSEREDVADVIASDQDIDLNRPSLVLGTSSTRRVALLKHFYPHIQTVEVRGNLQTRIAKMRSGLCDGLVLAFAGIHRMGYDDLIKMKLPGDRFIPAVGQGCIAIEAHQNLLPYKKELIRKLVNHSDTEKRLLAERAFLKKLEGGCSIPIFALARLDQQQIELTGGIVSLNGDSRIVKKASGSDPEHVGVQLADEILAAGGDKILAEIKNQL